LLNESRRFTWLLAVACGAPLLGAPAAAQTGVDVRLPDGRAEHVRIDAFPTVRVPVQENGLKRVYEGVLLRDVLASLNVPLGERLRGSAMGQVVVVVGQDGYRVVLALPEVDERFTDQQVLIATGHDGHGLIPDHGPLRLIVPRDKRPGRWVRQVVRVEVRDLP
jgi:DMSO/TMAO reductase YedYZ molybdopterin-dependent catalytic subunit